MPDNAEMITAALTHVLWIGGAPCAGKSSIAHAIELSHVFPGYHLDAWSRHHMARKLAQGDARTEAFLKMNMDQRWVQRSVEELVQEVLISWRDDFRLVIEDLLALPNEWFMVAEGNFFPESLAPYLSSPHQAIWLLPTDEFSAQIRRRRYDLQARRRAEMGVADESSNPEKRLNNLIARDHQLARHVKQQATERQLTFYEVDGSSSLNEMTSLVEEHFKPYIAERIKSFKYN